jgi:hypothetical protein
VQNTQHIHGLSSVWLKFWGIKCGIKVCRQIVQLKGTVSRDFLCLVFCQTAPSGPIRLRNNFDVKTKIEKLFDFKGDFSVYSPPGSFASTVYSPPRSLESPVDSSPGSHKFVSPVYSLPGSRDFPVFQHRV